MRNAAAAGVLGMAALAALALHGAPWWSVELATQPDLRFEERAWDLRAQTPFSTGDGHYSSTPWLHEVHDGEPGILAVRAIGPALAVASATALAAAALALGGRDRAARRLAWLAAVAVASASVFAMAALAALNLQTGGGRLVQAPGAAAFLAGACVGVLAAGALVLRRPAPGAAGILPASGPARRATARAEAAEGWQAPPGYGPDGTWQGPPR